MPNQDLKHTPLPWFVGYWSGQCHIDHRHGAGKCKYEYTRVVDNDWSRSVISGGDENNSIKIICSKEEPELCDEANAQLICTAVNSHYELREALEGLLKHQDPDSNLEYLRPNLYKWIKKSEQALKNSEGK